MAQTAGAKKQLKMASLLESAYELFTSKGVHETSIDDIVKRASVAKGTFYLYFKDKYDLLDRVILRKSAAIIDQAMNALDAELKCKVMSFEEKAVFFADYMIDYLKNNRQLLKVIRKNLSGGLFIEALEQPSATNAIDRFTADFMARGVQKEEAQQILYLIVEMTGAVCFSTIMNEVPCSIDQLKPTLYESIRKLLR